MGIITFIIFYNGYEDYKLIFVICLGYSLEYSKYYVSVCKLKT